MADDSAVEAQAILDNSLKVAEFILATKKQCWYEGWQAGVKDSHASMAAKLTRKPDPGPTRNPYD